MASKIPKLMYYSYNTNLNEWKLYMQKKPTIAMWHRNFVSWYRMYDTGTRK